MYTKISSHDLDEMDSLKSITTREQFLEYILKTYSDNSYKNLLISIIQNPKYNFLQCYTRGNVLYFRMFDREKNALFIKKIAYSMKI